MTPNLTPGTVYEHYKGMRYKILSTALHSETLEELIIYETLYENKLSKVWARPKKMFLEFIEINGKTRPRFKKV